MELVFRGSKVEYLGLGWRGEGRFNLGDFLSESKVRFELEFYSFDFFWV